MACGGAGAGIGASVARFFIEVQIFVKLVTIPFCVGALAEFGADLDPDRKENAPVKIESSLAVIGTDFFKGTKSVLNKDKKANSYRN